MQAPNQSRASSLLHWCKIDCDCRWGLLSRILPSHKTTDMTTEPSLIQVLEAVDIGSSPLTMRRGHGFNLQSWIRSIVAPVSGCTHRRYELGRADHASTSCSSSELRYRTFSKRSRSPYKNLSFPCYLCFVPCNIFLDLTRSLSLSSFLYSKQTWLPSGLCSAFCSTHSLHFLG